MRKIIYRIIIITIMMFILLGGVYPLFVTLAGNFLFPAKSSGGIIYKDGIPIGAKLIAQNFSQAKYFHSRPSAAGNKGYDATLSGASNLAPTNKVLIDRIEVAIQKFIKENPTIKREEIPPDLVTMSASGLDPDISLQAALIQIPRIANARNISENSIKAVVESYLNKPTFGLIGTEHINVLLLNMALDKETEKIKNKNENL